MWHVIPDFERLLEEATPRLDRLEQIKLWQATQEQLDKHFDAIDKLYEFNRRHFMDKKGYRLGDQSQFDQIGAFLNRLHDEHVRAQNFEERLRNGKFHWTVKNEPWHKKWVAERKGNPNGSDHK